MSVRVGTTLPLHAAWAGEEMPDIKRAARHAEEVGLDGVWAGDHLTTGFPILDSTVALTTAAAVTERIQVGYAVMLLALRQPAWAAKQIASLQHVSGNRLQLGVGVGAVGTPDEWQAAAVPSRSRGKRTDAILAALPGLVGGRPTALPTEPDEPVVTLEPAVLMPPVWIGGTSNAALLRTLTYGQGWLAALLSPDELADRAADLTALAEERSEPRPQIGTMVFATLTKQLGASPNVQASATCAGVMPSRLALLSTYSLPSTGLIQAKPEPAGPSTATTSNPRLAP